MKKKVIVACGGAVATSTLAAEEIKELCEENNISLELVQCRINEIDSYIQDVDLICTTSKISKTYGDIPIVHGMPFVSGVGVEQLKDKILTLLKG